MLGNTCFAKTRKYVLFVLEMSGKVWYNIREQCTVPADERVAGVRVLQVSEIHKKAGII